MPGAWSRVSQKWRASVGSSRPEKRLSFFDLMASNAVGERQLVCSTQVVPSAETFAEQGTPIPRHTFFVPVNLPEVVLGADKLC